MAKDNKVTGLASVPLTSGLRPTRPNSVTLFTPENEIVTRKYKNYNDKGNMTNTIVYKLTKFISEASN